MAYDVNASTWTAAELLDDVRRRAVLPSTAIDWTDSALYREAADVLWSFAGWAIQQAGDGRLSETFNRSVSAALGSSYRSASEFELPPQAVADTIESVAWVNADGTAERRLRLIDAAAQSDYDQLDSYGDPSEYALLGGRIRVYPEPTTGGVVRFQYQRRHPALVADTTSNVATVTAVADGGGGFAAFTLAATTPFAVGDTVDILSSQSPYRALYTSLTVGLSAAQTVTLYVPYVFLSTLNMVGVRLVKSGTSPYVHFPLELRPAVTEKIAATVLRTIGDLQAAGACEVMAKDELMRVMGMLSPRAKRDRPKAINHSSLMRRSLRR